MTGEWGEPTLKTTKSVETEGEMKSHALIYYMFKKRKWFIFYSLVRQIWWNGNSFGEMRPDNSVFYIEEKK